MSARRVLRTDSQRLSLYRFRHTLFQRYLYSSLDQVERAHLHQAVGTALETLYGEGVEEIAVQTMAYSRAYLEAAQELGSLSRVAHARFVLGFNLLWRGELDEAKEQINTALELAVRVGDMLLQTRCLTYLTILYRKLGQVEEATDYALQSLEAATSVQSPPYIGTARANLAWVAWRKANLTEALEKGKAALESWQQSAGYPLQWLALFPLAAVALAHGRIPEAVEYAHALLEPAQQALPDPLKTVLEEAIRTWERDEPEAARAYLDRVIELAQEMGYL